VGGHEGSLPRGLNGARLRAGKSPAGEVLPYTIVFRSGPLAAGNDSTIKAIKAHTDCFIRVLSSAFLRAPPVELPPIHTTPAAKCNSTPESFPAAFRITPLPVFTALKHSRQGGHEEVRLGYSRGAALLHYR
jgi:hypothetical protein